MRGILEAKRDEAVGEAIEQAGSGGLRGLVVEPGVATDRITNAIVDNRGETGIDLNDVEAECSVRVTDEYRVRKRYGREGDLEEEVNAGLRTRLDEAIGRRTGDAIHMYAERKGDQLSHWASEPTLAGVESTRAMLQDDTVLESVRVAGGDELTDRVTQKATEALTDFKDAVMPAETPLVAYTANIQKIKQSGGFKGKNKHEVGGRNQTGESNGVHLTSAEGGDDGRIDYSQYAVSGTKEGEELESGAFVTTMGDLANAGVTEFTFNRDRNGKIVDLVASNQGVDKADAEVPIETGEIITPEDCRELTPEEADRYQVSDLRSRQAAKLAVTAKDVAERMIVDRPGGILVPLRRGRTANGNEVFAGEPLDKDGEFGSRVNATYAMVA